jgi:hypothetical protein
MAAVVVAASLVPVISGNSLVRAGFLSQANPAFTIESEENLAIAIQSFDGGTTRLTYELSGFTWDAVDVDGISYQKAILGSESNIMEKGKPDLPNICRSIIIPDDAKMGTKIVSADFMEYEDVLIAPSKGVMLRSVNPSDVPFEFDAIYKRDEWYPGEIVELDDPYIIRDFRGQVVRVNPFQYNPARKTLRVYTDITVEVSSTGPGEINTLERSKTPVAVDPNFQEVYKRHFLNFGPNSAFYTVVGEQGNMLVITYDNFRTVMEPFVAWKNMKGIPTEMVDISSIGNNANSIKNYIRDYYNNNGLTFVLIVGDYQQVTTFRINFGYENGASDPTYSYIQGNDHYPDLFVGRFSAQSNTQVNTMVERSIEYERYPQEGANWYRRGAGIASNEGPGDDGEMDWEHVRNIRTDLFGYNYTAVDELYDGSHGGDDASGSPSSGMVTNSINAGGSVINYCGHGWDTGWVTSDYGTGHVNSLVNDNMLPFIWSVACNNGAFDDNSTCFAEAWLRATHNGEPTGAVGAFMSSIGQSWNPPMDAQDEMVDILIESYVDNIKHSYGGISFSGCMHMNDRYGGSGNEMTDTWHIFGDPSLEVRTDTPGSMTVDHPVSISMGSNGFEIDVSGAAGALCALSRDSEFLGSGYADETGHAIILLDAPLADGGDVDLCVTAYNMIPFTATVSIAYDGPEIYVDNSSPQFISPGSGGPWNSRGHSNACHQDCRFALSGTGGKFAGWRVHTLVEPGTYDVYAYKFDHDYLHLMATDTPYKIYYATGESGWITLDQSQSGNEWLYLGSFEFDNSHLQGVKITDDANGVVIIDAVKLVYTGP